MSARVRLRSHRSVQSFTTTRRHTRSRACCASVGALPRPGTPLAAYHVLVARATACVRSGLVERAAQSSAPTPPRKRRCARNASSAGLFLPGGSSTWTHAGAFASAGWSACLASGPGAEG